MKLSFIFVDMAIEDFMAVIFVPPSENTYFYTVNHLIKSEIKSFWCMKQTTGVYPRNWSAERWTDFSEAPSTEAKPFTQPIPTVRSTRWWWLDLHWYFYCLGRFYKNSEQLLYFITGTFEPIELKFDSKNQFKIWFSVLE